MAEWRLVDRVDEDVVRSLAQRVAQVRPTPGAGEQDGGGFDVEGFVADARRGWPDTLVPRLRHIADALEAHLPGDWWPVMSRVIEGLPEGQGVALGFEVWPITELLGRGTSRPADSLDLLRELGAKTYPELGVRPHLVADLAGTLAVVETWTGDPRPGVRRLASESTRPRLPWSPVLRALVTDPTPVLPILAALRDDPDHLVRNSVANHLNDITKDHPELVLDLLADWLRDPGDPWASDVTTQHLERRRWIAGRALRTLTGRGDPRALELLGLGPIAVTVEGFDAHPAVSRIGDAVVLAATVTNDERTTRQVRLELAIDYVRPRGRLSRKVFRWWEGALDPARAWSGRRTLSFADLSTRTHHPGRHRVELLANGQPVAELSIDLQPAE